MYIQVKNQLSIIYDTPKYLTKLQYYLYLNNTIKINFSFSTIFKLTTIFTIVVKIHFLISTFEIALRRCVNRIILFLKKKERKRKGKGVDKFYGKFLRERASLDFPSSKGNNN